MIEKIGPIKNPLTIIAIFAGIAEISGTIILPLLSAQIQETYVWFLILFPCLLVMLFFAVLLIKPYVLYAPSDYKDDKSFTDFFKDEPVNRRMEKLAEETNEVETTVTPQKSNQESVVDKTSKIPLTVIHERDIRAKIILSEEFAISKLSKDIGVEFKRNLTLKDDPNIRFDAIGFSSGFVHVVEVKFSSGKMLSEKTLLNSFDKVQSVLRISPKSVKDNLQYIFAVIVDTNDVSQLSNIKEQITIFSRKYDFRINIHVYSFNELEKEFTAKYTGNPGNARLR